MKHLHRFEAFERDAPASPYIQSLTDRFGDKEHAEQPLHEQVEAELSHLLTTLSGAEHAPEALNVVADYIELLTFALGTKQLDVAQFLHTEKRRAASSPYPLTPELGFGKDLTSGDPLVRTDSRTVAKLTGYITAVRNAGKLLNRLLRSKKETPFVYLPQARTALTAIENLTERNLSGLLLGAFGFIVFTYRVLRPLLKKEAAPQPDTVAGAGDASAPSAEVDDAPSRRNIGLRNAVGVGTAAMVALGKVVLPPHAFDSQGADATGCFRACQRMVGAPAPPNLGIKVAKEVGDTCVKLPTFDKGIQVIQQHLAAGRPIIVGVNDKRGSVNNDRTTDHFVVIVGSGKDDQGVYYQFYDPGTSHPEKGTSPENRFYLDSTGLLTGTSAYNKTSKRYTLAWVRPTA